MRPLAEKGGSDRGEDFEAAALFLHFDNAIFWMDSADRGRKRQYAAMLYRHTGLVPTSPGGRTFFEVLPSLALIRGQRREHFSWRHTDVPNHTVYFNLNNDQHEIVRPDHPAGGVKTPPRDRMAPTPRIVIPAKAGIQGWWRGATAAFPRSTPPGFPLSRE